MATRNRLRGIFILSFLITYLIVWISDAAICAEQDVRLWGVNVIAIPEPFENTYTRDYATTAYNDAWDFEEGDLENVKLVPGLKNVRVEDGKLKFTTGKDGNRLYWGNEEKVGWNWGEGLPLQGGTYRFSILIRMKQSLPSSTWKLFGMGRPSWQFPQLSNVRLSGSEMQTHYIDFSAGGRASAEIKETFSLETFEPGNDIEIDEIKIMQRSKNLYFRKEFTLDEPVEKAEMWILPGNDFFRIYVNGKEIYKDLQRLDGMIPTRVFDITNELREGKNAIGIVHDFFSYYNTSADLAGRIFITLKSGKQIDIRTDGTWKGGKEFIEGWNKPDFNNEGFTACEVRGDVVDTRSWLFPICNKKGVNVLSPYVGPIEMQVNPRYGMIFDLDKGIDCDVFARGTRKNPSLGYSLQQTYPHNKKYQGSLILKDNGKGGCLYRLNIPVEEPGTYLLTLSLKGDDKVIDERIEEVAVAGEIVQREIKGETYTEGLDLKLVDEVNCGDPNDKHLFTDSGLSLGHNPTSEIVDLEGIGKVRFSGKGFYGNKMDWFSYQVKFGHPNQPHMIEVEYPDSVEQTTLVQVEEYSGELTPQDALLKPGRVSDGRVSWGFASGGKDYSGKGVLAKERFICFPGHDWGTILIANGNMQGGSPAIRTIKVYEIENDLPKMKVNNQAEGRLFGYFPEAFGRMLMPYYTGQPDFFTVDPFWAGFKTEVMWKCWYKTIENLIKWMRFSGQNCIYWGAQFYDSEHYPTQNTNNYLCSSDYPALVAKMFEKNNLNVVFGIEFDNSGSLNEYENRLSTKDIRNGADTAAAVDKKGERVWSQAFFSMNYLHPLVQEECVRVAKDLAQLYKGFPAVKGILFNAGRFCSGGPALGPGIVPADNPMGVSYDDTTIRMFEEAKGIKIPVSFSDPERFEKRYAYINNNCRKEWIAFRCEATADLCRRIAQAVKDVNSNVETSFTWTNSYYGDWLSGETSILDHFRKSGSDFTLMKNLDLLQGPNYPMVPDRNFYGQGGYRAFQNEDLSPYFAPEKTCLGLHTLWYEWTSAPMGTATVNSIGVLEYAGRENSAKWFWTVGYHMLFEVRPCERYYSDALAAAFTWSTPAEIHYGVGDCNATTGSEQAIRNFTRAYYTLPPGEYTTLKNNGLDKNLVIRTTNYQGFTYFYVLNPLPFEQEVKIYLKSPAPVTNLIENNGEEADLLNLHLLPYQMKTFKMPVAGSFKSAETVLSEEGARDIQELMNRVTKYKKKLSDSPAEVERLNVINTMEEAYREGNLWETKRISTSRWLIGKIEEEKTKYGLSPEFNNLNVTIPYYIIGPFPNKNSSGFQKSFPVETDLLEGAVSKTYDGKGRIVGWEEVSTTIGPTGGPGYIDFMKEYLQEWGVGYAVTDVYSPENQKANLLIGSDDGIKIWVNGEEIFSILEARASYPSQNKADINLNKGWNRIVVKLEQQVGDWNMYLSISKAGDKLMSPDGIKYRLPLLEFKK